MAIAKPTAKDYIESEGKNEDGSRCGEEAGNSNVECGDRGRKPGQTREAIKDKKDGNAALHVGDIGGAIEKYEEAHRKLAQFLGSGPTEDEGEEA